jgi:subtilase family serine protease
VTGTPLYCTQAQVDDIEINFQRLAAVGVTIIMASGDSGSGCEPHAAYTKCGMAHANTRQVDTPPSCNN